MTVALASGSAKPLITLPPVVGENAMPRRLNPNAASSRASSSSAMLAQRRVTCGKSCTSTVAAASSSTRLVLRVEVLASVRDGGEHARRGGPTTSPASSAFAVCGVAAHEPGRAAPAGRRHRAAARSSTPATTPRRGSRPPTRRSRRSRRSTAGPRRRAAPGPAAPRQDARGARHRTRWSGLPRRARRHRTQVRRYGTRIRTARPNSANWVLTSTRRSRARSARAPRGRSTRSAPSARR